LFSRLSDVSTTGVLDEMKSLMIATALLVLSGCERAAEVEQLSEEKQQQVTKPVRFTTEQVTLSNQRDIYLITDQETGCQYFSGHNGYDTNVFMTPRLNADGTQMCRKGQVTQ
jgi:hypothetical protein